jgi:hypothetical protein
MLTTLVTVLLSVLCCLAIGGLVWAAVATVRWAMSDPAPSPREIVNAALKHDEEPDPEPVEYVREGKAVPRPLSTAEKRALAELARREANGGGPNATPPATSPSPTQTATGPATGSAATTDPKAVLDTFFGKK